MCRRDTESLAHTPVPVGVMPDRVSGLLDSAKSVNQPDFINTGIVGMLRIDGFGPVSGLFATSVPCEGTSK